MHTQDWSTVCHASLGDWTTTVDPRDQPFAKSRIMRWYNARHATTLYYFTRVSDNSRPQESCPQKRRGQGCFQRSKHKDLERFNRKLQCWSDLCAISESSFLGFSYSFLPLELQLPKLLLASRVGTVVVYQQGTSTRT